MSYRHFFRGMLFSTLCIYVSAKADISHDLGQYFDSLGYASNVTAPQTYQGQQAGYYTGGSIFARNSVRDVQIANIQLPSYSAGCGGIDLFGGGFSFINADELVDLMRNVLNSAKSYAFNLALESATPEIANTMKYATDMATKINQSNINSCETSAALVGSVWPKTHEAQRHVCADIGTNKSLFSDYAASRQGCGNQGKMSSTLKEGLKDDKYRALILDSGNLAWKALQQNAFLQSDTGLAELFMSLSGTIIIQKDGNDDKASHHFKVLSSLAGSDSLIKALLYGGDVRIYHCDTKDECLNPTVSQQSTSIDPTQGLQSKVKHLLDEMVNAIHNDKALTQAQKGLLNATRLPVYKMLNVQTAFAHGSNIVNVSDYADIIAIDILFQYLTESLNVVKTSANTLQYPAEILTQFQTGLDAALSRVRTAHGNAYKQVNLSLQMIQQTQAIEQMLAGQLSTELVGTLSWARGLH